MAGYFNQPTGIAISPQGDAYVVDSLNHRVQRFDATGQFLGQVGQQGKGDGEFNEPWGIAVDKQGNVYVADTWNHRIQVFTADLRFVRRWGEFSNGVGMPKGGEGNFYGPRGIAVDEQGYVYVTDTGNKRVQKFDSQGRFVASFGGVGSEAGQLSEPVGIQVDQAGNIYVADTWNRRVQIFNSSFQFLSQFSIYGWESQGVLNKPFLALEEGGNIIVVSDPENHRLLRFSQNGALLAVVGGFGTEPPALNLPLGVSVDEAGRLWVAEGANHRVQRLVR
jgi:DNA-binding beta-propeller fold protein YncE